MIYLIFIVIIIVLILIFYPFRMTIYNKEHYLCFNFTNFITIKLNLLVLFDNNHNEDIQKQVNLYRLIDKVKIEDIKFYVRGVNLNYTLNPVYLGSSYAILSILDNYLRTKNIQFEYKLDYLGDKSLKFQSSIRTNLINFIRGVITS